MIYYKEEEKKQKTKSYYNRARDLYPYINEEISMSVHPNTKLLNLVKHNLKKSIYVSDLHICQRNTISCNMI